jgi:hypothetical protein
MKLNEPVLYHDNHKKVLLIKHLTDIAYSSLSNVRILLPAEGAESIVVSIEAVASVAYQHTLHVDNYLLST